MNIRQNSSNKRSNSAHSGNIQRPHTTIMDNSLNDSYVVITKDNKSKTDDVKVDIIKEDVTHANDLLSSPHFLRIPLKPIEQPPPPTDVPINEKT